MVVASRTLDPRDIHGTVSAEGGGEYCFDGECGEMCFDDDGNAQKVWSYVGPGQGRFDKVERYMPVAGGSWTIKEVEPRSKIWGCVCCWCGCLLATALAAVLAWLYRDLLFDTLGRADANVESLVHHTPLYDCGRGRWTTSLRAQTDEASKIYRNTMWQDADYNRDGLVSAAELRSGSSKLPECFSQRIYQWDKDGNGLSQAELDFGLQAMFDADAARTFAVADRDCDGYLSLEELGALKASSSLPGYTLDILGGADVDADKKLSQLEFVAAIQKAGLNQPGAGVEVGEIWNETKRQWCCEFQSLGCQNLAPEVQPGLASSNCLHGDVDMWDIQKRQRCCQATGRGCPNQLGTQFNLEHDCQPSLHNPLSAWNMDKRAYCCQTRGNGCDRPQMYDCLAGIHNWQQGWSLHKKVWCCDNKKLGCATEQYNCDTAVSSWGSAQRSFCCREHHRGCAKPTIPEETDDNGAAKPLFDCRTGWPKGWKAWSTSKKDFCCSNYARGCKDSDNPEGHIHSDLSPRPLPVSGFDCQAGLANWHSWKSEKKTWCCAQRDIACSHHGSFDCEAGSPKTWKTSKKDYCCLYSNKGCEFDASDSMQPAAESHIYHNFDYSPYGHYGHYGHDIHYGSHVPVSYEPYTHGHGSLVYPAGHWTHSDAGGQSDNFQGNGGRFEGGEIEGTVPGQAVWEPGSAEGAVTNEEGFEPGSEEGAVTGEEGFEPGSEEGAVTGEEGIEPGSEEGAVTNEEGFEPGSEEGAATGEEGFEPGSEEGAVTGEEGFEPGSEEGAVTGEEGFEPGSEEGAVTGEEGFEPGSEEGAVTGEEGFEPGSEEGTVLGQGGFEPGSEEGAVTNEEGFEPGSEEGAVLGQGGFEPEEGAVGSEEGFEPASVAEGAEGASAGAEAGEAATAESESGSAEGAEAGADEGEAATAESESGSAEGAEAGSEKGEAATAEAENDLTVSHAESPKAGAETNSGIEGFERTQPSEGVEGFEPKGAAAEASGSEDAEAASDGAEATS